MLALLQILLGAAFRASHAKPQQLPWRSSPACLLILQGYFLPYSSPPLIHGFAFHSFSYPRSAAVRRQNVLLRMYFQKVKGQQ